MAAVTAAAAEYASGGGRFDAPSATGWAAACACGNDDAVVMLMVAFAESVPDLAALEEDTAATCPGSVPFSPGSDAENAAALG